MTITSEDLTNKKIFLESLLLSCQAGYLMYQEYLNCNKKFMFAKIIKENNEKISDMILNHIHLFSYEQRSDLILIVNHINSWCRQWENLYEQLNPNLEDEFVFNTLINFPKKSILRLENYYFINFKKNFQN